MAEGGGDASGDEGWFDKTEDFTDHGDQPASVSQTQIGDQTRVLVNHFISERLRRETASNELNERELFVPNTPTSSEVVGPQYQAIGNSLQMIGDQLDGDTRLQNLIVDLPADCPYQTFKNVAKGIFSDGNFNWGRVVMLFYIAFKLAKKSLSEVSIIRNIVEWVVKFVKDYLANWILSRGGWSAIQEYFGSTTGQAVDRPKQSDSLKSTESNKSDKRRKCSVL